MPGKNRKYLGKILIIITLMLWIPVMSFFRNSVFADDKCASIEDLDEKYECYSDQKDKKEKEYESTSKKLNSLLGNLNKVNSTISNLSSQLNVTQKQMSDLEADINEALKELDTINKNLTDRRAALQDKIDLRNNVIRNYSKKSGLSEIELFLNSGNDSDLTGFQFSTFAYIFNKSVTEETIKIIGIINNEINSYEADKQEAESIKTKLEEAHNKLEALKVQLEKQKNSAQSEQNNLEKDKKETEADLQDIQDSINKLNDAQQSILNQKSGAGTSSVGDYEQPEVDLSNPPFSPAFVAMSYGAYTHYNGMSQYGAKGRAESGQSYKDIIKFYYKVDTKKQDDFPGTISVQGYGTMDFQKYLYGIAEMPSDWPSDALKAQAIAARTYAYKSSKPICTSESCQVFLKSKSDNPPSAWKKAVDDTKGIILNNSSTSQYSSTTGGYINNVGWDLKGSSWPNDAYEKKAGSPWFYKAWYTKSYSTSSDKCGRSSPWLSSKEMADILNAVTVWQKGSNSDRNKISPVTTSCWGGDPYSIDDMADRADDLGTKYTSVSNADTDIGSNGQTLKVTFQTDQGSVSIDGQVFKTVFNLRAPGYISIRSRIYDMIKK